MRKAAIALIIIGVLVVVGANLFIGAQPEPELAPVRDDSTLRSTTSGDVVGFRDRYGARSWQGVPFAQPPVKALRWQAPEPPIAAEETIEALAPGRFCPQFASLLSTGNEQNSGGVVGDEDCLYLNIWSPPNAAGLPVMVWIHGGGNTIGHGGSYNGSALAADRDVVVVTINYRLGIFGWFNHPQLHTGDPLDDSGNYGTLDTIRALQWVQNNIREFGGDPGNVTVFGESAGGYDTLALMASPLAEDLFHRAIVQSGGFGTVPLTMAQNYQANGGHPFSSREIVAKLLVADGTAANHDAAVDYAQSMGAARLKEYLYAKTPSELFALFDGGGFGMINLPDGFADGHVLPALSNEELFGNLDNHNAVPVILGTNRDEPAIFMVRDPRYVDNWLGFLPRLKDPESYALTVKYGALAWKERGVDSLAELMTQAGNEQVYAYRFDWDEEPSQFGFDLSTALGAAHGLEIAFVFDEFDGGMNISYVYPGDEAQFALADSMADYWTQFAHTGDPGNGLNGDQVEWLAWGEQGKHTLLLDSPADQGIRMASGIVTLASITEALAAEEGFTDPQDKCRLYVRNFRDNFNRADYLALDPACADVDPENVSRF